MAMESMDLMLLALGGGMIVVVGLQVGVAGRAFRRLLWRASCSSGVAWPLSVLPGLCRIQTQAAGCGSYWIPRLQSWALLG